MPLQVSAFRGSGGYSANGHPLQIIGGPPAAVTSSTFTGEYTVPADVVIVRLHGEGTVTWPGIANAEAIKGTEYRGVRPGTKFTVA